ncbi:MAG: PilZ domain-containing protein [Alicyclobacillus sp.]|nr:PilZ domain-containing protein [Alicyclobacillus sp.]
MVVVRLPEIGQELRVKRAPEDEQVYRSRLIDLGQSELYLDVPVRRQEGREELLPFQEGERLWIEFIGDGTLCEFPTRVLDRVSIPVSAWRVSMPQPGELIRVQRREFVRVPANLPVELWLPAEDGQGSVSLRAYTRNISGGGLAVTVAPGIAVAEGAEVRARFTLPNGNVPVDVRCVVVRATPVPEPSSAGEQSPGAAGSPLQQQVGEPADVASEPSVPTVVSLRFLDLKETVRQRIIQFTFQRQRMR